MYINSIYPKTPRNTGVSRRFALVAIAHIAYSIFLPITQKNTLHVRPT
jgi:hypothetical protein